MSFADDTAAIFAGPLGTAAVWRARGEGDGVAVNVIPSEPDADLSFGSSRVVVPNAILRCPVALAPGLSRGDTIQIGDAIYDVTAAPQADARRLWWTVEASKRAAT